MGTLAHSSLVQDLRERERERESEEGREGERVGGRGREWKGGGGGEEIKKRQKITSIVKPEIERERERIIQTNVLEEKGKYQ